MTLWTDGYNQSESSRPTPMRLFLVVVIDEVLGVAVLPLQEATQASCDR